MFKQLTPEAFQQGIKNMAICLIICVIFSVFLVLPAVFLFKLPIMLAVTDSSCILEILIFPLFIYTWIRDRKRSGSVVLDCGPIAWRIAFIFYSVVFAIGAVLIISKTPSQLGLFYSVSLFLASIYFFYFQAGRLQIRENGIWIYCNLTLWEQIAWYHWTENGTLFFRTKQVFSFSKGALPIGKEYQQAVDDFLREHCPYTNADELYIEEKPPIFW
jgi:hypothetical protein